MLEQAGTELCQAHRKLKLDSARIKLKLEVALRVTFIQFLVKMNSINVFKLMLENNVLDYRLISYFPGWVDCSVVII